VKDGVHKAYLQFKVSNHSTLDAEASSYTVTFRPSGSRDRIEVATGEVPAIEQGRTAWVTAPDVTGVIQRDHPELIGVTGFFEVIVDSDFWRN